MDVVRRRFEAGARFRGERKRDGAMRGVKNVFHGGKLTGGQQKAVKTFLQGCSNPFRGPVSPRNIKKRVGHKKKKKLLKRTRWRATVIEHCHGGKKRSR